jgi:hypothetical protein
MGKRKTPLMGSYDHIPEKFREIEAYNLMPMIVNYLISCMFGCVKVEC